MGAEDMARQALNVVRMRLLGATVRQVDAGSRTLKDAINEAMRDWVANVADTYYLLGSRARPASVSADGARVPDRHRPRGARADAGAGRPAARRRRGVRRRRQQRDRHLRRVHRRRGRAADRRRGRRRGASRRAGTPRASPAARTGVLQGTRTYVLQDAHGNIELTHSISAGLDYAAVGPEHAWLREQGRTEYAYATDAEALDGVSGARAARRDPAGARVGARRRARDARRARARPPTPSSWSICRAAATRTCRRVDARRSRTMDAGRARTSCDVTDCGDVRSAEGRGPAGPGDLRHGRRSATGAHARSAVRARRARAPT